jgi:hypothetical protein
LTNSRGTLGADLPRFRYRTDIRPGMAKHTVPEPGRRDMAGRNIKDGLDRVPSWPLLRDAPLAAKFLSLPNDLF